MHFGKYRNHWENKQWNEQKLGTGVDKALSCLGDLLGPMSTLGDIGSYKCHFEMNLETAGHDQIKHLPHAWMIELYNWVTKPCLRLPYILCLLVMTKCSSYLLLAIWQRIVSNWRLAYHMNLSLGRCPVELAQESSRVALVRGFAILEKSLDNLLEKFLIQFPEQTNPW